MILLTPSMQCQLLKFLQIIAAGVIILGKANLSVSHDPSMFRFVPFP